MFTKEEVDLLIKLIDDYRFLHSTDKEKETIDFTKLILKILKNGEK